MSNLSNHFTKNLYFGKSLSPQIAPILPFDDKDSDDDIIIILYSTPSTHNRCPADIKIDPDKDVLFSMVMLNMLIICNYDFLLHHPHFASSKTVILLLHSGEQFQNMLYLKICSI